jgi:hypothetical protein
VSILVINSPQRHSIEKLKTFKPFNRCGQSKPLSGAGSLSSLRRDGVAMLQISADVMLSESEASAFPTANENADSSAVLHQNDILDTVSSQGG